MDLHSLKQVGPLMAVDPGHNILLTYHCHGPPLRFATVPTSELRYVAKLTALCRWCASWTKPPGTLVVVRTPNLKALTLYETLTNSDWYSLQHLRVLRAMFKGLPSGVLLVDAWEMTLAHSLPHSLHPQPPIIKNMMDVLLSNVCPQR